MAYEVATRPHFLEGSHRFAKTSLGYEASEPPRWCSLGCANTDAFEKGTYNDYLAVTNTSFLLGRALKDEERTKKNDRSKARKNDG